MKFNKVIFIFCSLLLISTGVRAGLILNITDNGSGFAQFSLSGSDTVSSGSDATNGVWLDNTRQPQLVSLFSYIPTGGGHALTSGSGSITNTQFGTQSIYDVYISGFSNCCDFGIRSGNGGILSTGDTISWAGLFTTDILYNVFNAGTYNFNILASDNYPGATLTDGLVINVGTSIPTPAPLALICLGLAAIGYCRKRKA